MVDVPPWVLRQSTGFTVLGLSLALLTVALAPVVHDATLPAALAYLLVALVCAAVWGWLVGAVAAVAANLVFNFFFVEPLHRFYVDRAEDIAGLAMFLAVAAIGAGMLSLLRRQLEAARTARGEADVLLAVSREVAEGVTARDALDRLCTSVARALGANSCAILRPNEPWEVVATSAGLTSVSREEENLASEALRLRDVVSYDRERGLRTGHGRERSAGVLSFVPVVAGPGAPAVMRFVGRLEPPAGIPLQPLLDAFKEEVSVGVNRAVLQNEMVELERLKRADELKSALLSSVSHDLRTPLTAIKAAAGNLRDGDARWAQEDQEMFLETIQEQTERLSATVDGLLAMSRLEGGAVPVRREFIEVGPLLEEVVQAVRPLLVDRCVSVSVPTSCWVHADYRLLFQAVQNLVENAAKHTSSGGRIDLGAEQAGSAVLLWVEDDGTGISPADLPHVFEKFYRGRGEGEKTPGVGLGLSIVKAMVELNGGAVRAEPRDVGARFVVELPAAPAPR